MVPTPSSETSRFTNSPTVSSKLRLRSRTRLRWQLMPAHFQDRLRRALNARKPRRVSLADARDAAVLIPVVGSPAPTLIFTVRTETLPSHKGQISFPGGSIDPDESPVQAALREANEEIGIEPGAVEVLGELDSMPTFVSGYVIAPVV